MIVVLDTNVVVSGAFFGGVPARVLEACYSGRVTLALTPEILGEYVRVGERLARRYEGVDLTAILGALVLRARFVDAAELSVQVCDDPADDKFLACALGAGAKVIVTGDAALLRVSGYQGVRVVRPRDLVKELFG